jgi:chemotaxis response regulator CheB
MHVGLVVEAEFLRLVLRQLLRRMAGEIAFEAATPAEAQAQPPTQAIIADVTPCATDLAGFATLCRLYQGRTVLIGNSDTVTRPGLTIPPDVIQVPMGTQTTARDLSVLASRLEAGLRPLMERMRCPAPFGSDPSHPVLQPTLIPKPMPPLLAPAPRRTGRVRRPELILIAASTGGPEALQDLFSRLQRPICPIVVALHIPAEHTQGLARHLASVTGHSVTVAEAGPLPSTGVVLLQGGMDHLVIERNDGFWLRRAPAAASVFHPNGDVLLNSGAALDRAVVGVVLTGMGNDGCAGATALAARGFPVLAQSPGSCAVPGMPAAAIAAGAVREVTDPAGIAERLNAWFALPIPVDLHAPGIASS